MARKRKKALTVRQRAKKLRDPAELVALLREVGSNYEKLGEWNSPLDPVVRDAIAAVGAPALPHLLAIIQDRALWDADEERAWSAPIHAAHVLGRLGLAEAVEPLLTLLMATASHEPWGHINSACAHALSNLGEAASLPLMQALRATEVLDERVSLLEALSTTDLKDPAMLEAMLEAMLAVLAADPSLGAMYLAETDHPAALPALQQALADCSVRDESGSYVNRDFLDILDAIEQKDGVLDAAQERRKQEALFLARSEDQEHLSAMMPPADLGRNDLCWCGSGQKFKRCHGAPTSGA